ncbi:MAG: PQQ-binding-like beta-propeller repeat protein [Hyphomicrobiaceae bacterium]
MTSTKTSAASARYTRARGVAQALVAAIAAPLALGACASDSLPSLPKLADLNPFAEKQVPLAGKRVSIVSENRLAGGGELAAADKPISIPAFVGNENWTQPGGTANNTPGHLALNATVKVGWSANAGTGSSKYGKVSASPIVAGGRVYTLDAAGKVSAFSTTSGSTVWTASVVPEGEKIAEKGYGGGLAIDNGRIYVATGFGTMLALDPASGKKLWEKSVGVPVRASPTAAADRVLAVTIDGELVCLQGSDGAELWRYKGITGSASLITNTSPAIEGDLVIAPFASGDVVGVKLATGQPVWTESLARARLASSFQSMSDAARPAIESGTVYAVGHAGRMVATLGRSGERLWSNSVSSIQQPIIAGDTIFVADTLGQLIALTKRDGKVQWTVKLPGEGTWSGPVLAGNKLWAVSSKGQLASVEATTGKNAGSLDLGQPIYIAPIVAGARMFVLTDKAKLIALN